MPHVHTAKVRSMQFRPIAKIFFWFFVADFIILTIIGGKPVEEPWVIVGQIASVFYFAYFLVFTPLIGILENKLLKLS
jgi:ubiquinol-cytochrome c reductase cytochrome b subunit